MSRKVEEGNESLKIRRVVLSLTGMLLAGVAVGFFKRAFFGVDPFQCLCNGLANVLPIRFGTLYMLINAVMLAVVFFLDRHFIGISTFINLFLLGYVVEFSESQLAMLLGDLSPVGRFLFLMIGILLSCIAAALYYSADLGVSAYDAIPLYLSDRKYTCFGRVIPFRLIRIFSDLVCVLTGWLLGFLPGIGTIITAFFMGPLITFFRRTITDPLVTSSRRKTG